MKEKLKAIWKILCCKGFYIATARRGGVWNSIYEFNTRDARCVIESLEQMVEDSDDGEDAVRATKSIINQHDTK